MGTLSVGDQRLSFEQIAQEAADREYLLVIEYQRARGMESETVELALDVAGRQETTKDTVQDALRKWSQRSPGTTIQSFEVVEQVECRRGERIPENGKPGPEAIDGPVPGVDAGELSPGDRVAYYVDGPHSSVYGYVAEGVVEKVPPWKRGGPSATELVRDRAVLEVGDRTREIPLAWIIGSTDDEDVADAVDRPLST